MYTFTCHKIRDETDTLALLERKRQKLSFIFKNVSASMAKTGLEIYV